MIEEYIQRYHLEPFACEVKGIHILKWDILYRPHICRCSVSSGSTTLATQVNVESLYRPLLLLMAVTEITGVVLATATEAVSEVD